MKKEEILILTYSQLCEKFGEKRKDGGKRTRQFERWRKNYSIEKMEKKNKYIVKELSLYEKTKDQLYFNYQQYVEPMIYELLLNNEEDYQLTISPMDFMLQLGLVNSNYKLIKYNDVLADRLAQLITARKQDVEDYQYEVSKLNKRVIKNVLDAMERHDLIKYSTTFIKKVVVDDIIVEQIMSPKETADLLDKRKKISKSMFGKDYFYITKEDKKTVNSILKDELNITNYYDVYNIILNKDGIRDDIVNLEYTFADKISLTNAKNQIKINKSKQGKLKEIPTNIKQNMTQKLIDLSTEVNTREQLKGK